MPLDDAVRRLRGKPGTKVTIWVHRDGDGGWAGSRPFELVREEIQIKSVEARPLGGGVGYVRIKQFQSSTSDELEASLAELHEEGAAARSGARPARQPRRPARSGGQGRRPFPRRRRDRLDRGRQRGSRREARIARAVPNRATRWSCSSNGSSASASEIVAGALKNHDRAVIVGQTTFGKGTVQLVFPRITPDNAALKLTIAQYLTPGDISIQGVGVAAGRRARSDDRRHAGDGSLPLGTTAARARSLQEPDRRRASAPATGRSSSFATICRRASAR